MKKIFCFIFVLITCFALTLSVSAEEASLDEETVGEVTEVTILDRIEEFIAKYTTELISGGGIAATVGMFLLIWKKIKPDLKDMLLKIGSIIKSSEDSADVQDKHSKAINSLIDAVDLIDKKITDFERITSEAKKSQGETVEHFKEIQRSLATLARLFDTAYSNNKALPQGTKEIIHSACAECIMIAEHEIYGETEGNKNECEQ